jgi:integrase/recombinase XerD
VPRTAQRPPEVLTADEAEAILKQPNRKAPTGLRNRCIIEVMYRAGLRVSEVTGLRPSQVRWSQNRIEIRKSKRGKGRNIPVRQSTMELLEQWKAVRPDSEWFFSTCCERGGIAAGNKVGARLSSQYIQAMVRRYASRAGVERRVTPHMWRHTAATDWLNAGLTIREVQQLCGHSRLDTTMIYTHVNDKALAAKIAALDKASP